MTMPYRVAMGILVLIATSACITAQPITTPMNESPSQVDPHPVEGTWIVVTGTVRRVGAEPFSELVITDSDEQDWYVQPEDVFLLRTLEQQQVRVRGMFRLRQMILADGRELPPRYELRELQVMPAEK